MKRLKKLKRIIGIQNFSLKKWFDGCNDGLNEKDGGLEFSGRGR